MKRNLHLCFTMAVCALVLGSDTFLPSARAATFQNLGFESPTNLPFVPPGPSGTTVPFADAFPGWTGFIGGAPVTNALYDTQYLDHSAISLIDSGYYFGGLIEGNYSALLQAGLNLTNGQPADASLVQTAQVPFAARSLIFKAYSDLSPFGSYTVSLNGQPLPVITLSNGVNFSLFGADVTGWANQPVQLSFTLIADSPHQFQNRLFLDSIQFSPTVIPEPGVFALFALGGGLFAWRVRRRS